MKKNRFGWILFDSEENCNKGAHALSNLVIKNYGFTIVKSKGQRKPLKVFIFIRLNKNEKTN